MNNSKQRSLLEAVDSIVNKRNNDALYAQITEAICYGLQDFEDKMGVELTEEQEKLLTQIGFDQCMNSDCLPGLTTVLALVGVTHEHQRDWR